MLLLFDVRLVLVIKRRVRSQAVMQVNKQLLMTKLLCCQCTLNIVLVLAHMEPPIKIHMMLANM